MVLIIIRWLIITGAILIASMLVPGITVDSHGNPLLTTILAAAVLGLINVFIKPVLIILTLPLSILTLGLFTLFLNALLLQLVAYFVKGFEVSGFLAAFLGSLIISIVTWFANYFINIKPEKSKRQDFIDLEKGDDGKWR